MIAPPDSASMTVDPAQLKILIENELRAIQDRRIVDHIRSHLIEPIAELRDWDYGEAGQQYPCWVVFKRDSSEIAFCENGFGPRSPWGVLWPISSPSGVRSMGQDSAWFVTFMDAFFNSGAAKELPIWRVFRVGGDGSSEPVSEEGAWEDTWAKVYASRNSDPRQQYVCDNSVAIGCRE